MANVFLKAEKIVNQGLGMLQRELILPRLVTRYNKSDFVGAKDDTVKIPIPSHLLGREYGWRNDRSSPIVVDDLAEQSISVTLNKHAYSAIGVTDEELTLDITNWGVQVATPQTVAVAEKLESYVADAMETADTLHSVGFSPDIDDADDRSFFQAALAARRYLNEQNVPAAGRVIVLGAEVEEAALQSKHIVDVDKSGSDSALRDAVVGRIAGFQVIGNVNSVPEDFAMAFHPTAFGFANLAPEVPEGVTKGGNAAYAGLALRWIKDYDSDYLRDRSVYSSFAGAVSVEDGRVIDPESEDFGELTGKNVRAVEIAYTPGS